MTKSTKKTRQLEENPIFSDIRNTDPSFALSPNKAEKLTPMITQFAEIKKDYPDCLLFYRMGDFYELFFSDAIRASAAINITLTARGKIGDKRIPMCGVPYHSYENYLAKLIQKGFRVAICEQMEDPAEAKKRGGKTLVKRGVTRVVTAGTITEENLLESHRHNYLSSITQIGNKLALAWVDMASGTLMSESPDTPQGLSASLARIEPAEIIISEILLENPDYYEVWADWKNALTRLPNSRFDSTNSNKRLQDIFKTSTLDSFGQFNRAEIAALGALVDYIALTQTGRLPRLSPPTQLAHNNIMEIDAATRRNLELTQTLSGSRKGALLDTIDKTQTAGGARLLAEYLATPLLDIRRIKDRLSRLSYFANSDTTRNDIRQKLKTSPDGARALTRICLMRGGPRDVAALRDSLECASYLGLEFSRNNNLNNPPKEITEILAFCTGHEALIEKLHRALKPENLPLLTRDGGFIKEGFSPALDEFTKLNKEGRSHTIELQSKYIEISGVPNLKVKHNNVLGYFIEVTAKNGDALMTAEMAETFIHRQTLANQIRFTTTELANLERRIDESKGKALALELKLFDALIDDIISRADMIDKSLSALAKLDVASSLAELAISLNWSAPKIDNSTAFEIIKGRHPVVEAAVNSDVDSPPYVPNDCNLENSKRLWLLTGPNMAGKSTFLRQNALIAILAQTGSFVPAEKAHIGVIDKLFSRVGASDDLARGRSTFMVEMVETATILNRATPKSLVILDEIGRGTATFDGLSIAWASLEHLHEKNQCRSLFATHYHELTSLKANLSALSCHNMRVKEWQSQIIFLHEVTKGTANRSYGIHVARLAGLPPSVIKRAETVLQKLEKGEQTGCTAKLVDDLPLFSSLLENTGKLNHSIPNTTQKESPALDHIKSLNPDNLTPKEALDALYEIYGMAKEEG